jgi:hypothetical protein
MKLKDKLGFKRLALVLPVAVLLYTYLEVMDVVGHLYGAIFAVFLAGSTYVVLRMVYWVIDGFREEDSQP